MINSMSRFFLHSIAALALCTEARHLHAQTMWEDYAGFPGAGYAGIAVGDFDGNGSVEAAVPGYSIRGFNASGSQLLGILSKNDVGTLGVRDMTLLPSSLSGPLVALPKVDGMDRLAVASSSYYDTQILILAGVPLRIVRTVAAPMIHHIVAVADVDADGQLEFVGVTTNAPYNWMSGYPVVMDFETGEIEWTGASLVTDVGVTQLDADPALELILSASPGRVLDGATHAVEWSYPGGLLRRIVVGHFDADPTVPGFAVIGAESIQIFRTQPYSPVRQIDTPRINSARTVRLTAEGPDVIAVGTAGRLLAIYDPRSGERVFSRDYEGSGISGVAVGDLDDDGHTEIVFGTDLGSTGEDVLRAVDLETIADDYVQGDEVGPHAAVAVGDLAGTGSEQVAYLTADSGASFGGSNLRVLDATTGARLRARANVFGMWGYVYPQIAFAQLDTDPQLEIVISGGRGYSGMVAVLDGISLQDQWRVGGDNTFLNYAWVDSLGMQDVNGDGSEDIVVGIGTGRIVVLEGRTGALVWQSPELSGYRATIVVPFHTALQAPRVALLRENGLYVFDPVSHTLKASTQTPVPLAGLVQWGEGTACRLGALDEQYRVTFYRCDDLGIEGQVMMPPDTVFFRPVDSLGSRFVAAARGYLHEVLPNGRTAVIAGPMGYEVGTDNRGIVSAAADGKHVDVVLGSDYMVTRVRVQLDTIYGHGFE